MPKGDLTSTQMCENQKRDTIRLSDPDGGWDQKSAVGSSVLACDQQGPVGQTPVRQSYSQSVGEMEREVDLEIKKTSSSSLPREACERKKRFQMQIDKRIRFQGQEPLVFGVLTSKQIPFFNSELCGQGFGRIPIFPFFPFFVPFFPLFQFAVPFFSACFVCSSVFFRFCRFQFRLLFASSGKSVQCFFLLWVRASALGSGFLGFRVSGLKV